MLNRFESLMETTICTTQRWQNIFFNPPLLPLRYQVPVAVFGLSSVIMTLPSHFARFPKTLQHGVLRSYSIS